MSMLNKIYLNEWVEEGVVENQLTNDYEYYDKLIVMDYDGNVVSERKGSLSQYPNGKWYLS